MVMQVPEQGNSQQGSKKSIYRGGYGCEDCGIEHVNLVLISSAQFVWSSLDGLGKSQ